MVTLRLMLAAARLLLGAPHSSPATSVQWKAILLVGDSSAPVFDNATRDLARLLERRGVSVVAGSLLTQFPKATTWEELHTRGRRCIDAKEASQKDPPSEPQLFIGEGMKDVALPLAW